MTLKADIDSTSLYNIPRKSQSTVTMPSASAPTPSITPLTYDVLPSKSRTNTPSPKPVKKKQNGYVQKPVTSSMSLKDVIKEYQHKFPIEVEVTSGFFGETDEDTFSEGDKLNFHFVKHVSVAVIETCNGTTIRLPLNSDMQFAILYNPNDDLKEAVISGFTFKSVKELLMQKKLPKVVCATKEYSSNNSNYSVEKGEFLIINEVKHGRFGGQSLMCTSLVTSKQKRLSESCQGQFTTHPNSLKLYILELTSKFADDLPMEVVVMTDSCSSNQAGASKPKLSFNEVVKVKSVEKETAIIATPFVDGEEVTENGNPIVFDIPVNLDLMEVQVLEPRANMTCEKLYEDTRQLFESYDPTNQIRVGSKTDEDVYCYTSFRTDQKNIGVDILPPENIYSDRSSIVSDYNTLHQHPNAPLTEPTNPLSRATSSFTLSTVQEDEYCPMYKSVHPTGAKSSTGSFIDLRGIGDNAEESPVYFVSKLMENIQESRVLKELQEIRLCLANMQLQISDLTNNITEAGNRQSKQKELEATRAGVAAMTTEEVLDMLDTLKISQYRDIFESEGINGALLVELNDTDLEKDLGIISSLHRKKLMLAIQGKTPI
jgi:hypothetical protein